MPAYPDRPASPPPCELNHAMVPAEGVRVPDLVHPGTLSLPSRPQVEDPSVTESIRVHIDKLPNISISMATRAQWPAGARVWTGREPIDKSPLLLIDMSPYRRALARRRQTSHRFVSPVGTVGGLEAEPPGRFRGDPLVNTSPP